MLNAQATETEKSETEQTKPITQPLEMKAATLNQAYEFLLHSHKTNKDYRIQLAQIGNPSTQGYSVLYVLDGDYLFPIASLTAQTLNGKRDENNAVSLLVVGIGYPTGKLISPDLRAEDYTPPDLDTLTFQATAEANTGDQQNKKFGGAEQFSQFIRQELMPYLAQHYPINVNQQSLYGHSYGALFGLYDLFQHQTFRHYLLASPSIWWNQKKILQYLPHFLANPPRQSISIRFTGSEYEAHLPPYMSADEKRSAMLTQRAMLPNLTQLYQDLKTVKNLEVERYIYPKETHSSGAIPALVDGIKWIYAECKQAADCE